MAEEEETTDFERDEYGDMDEGQSQSQYQQAANDLMVQPHCDTGDCTAAQEEPAEAAWVKLMSAVPQATQINNLRAAREGTMLLPEGKTMQDLVASIRPQPEADYALDTIRDEWSDFYEDFRTIGPKLEQGLSDLSGYWKGEDFDAFEEQVEIVLKNCRTIIDDIAGEEGDGGVVKLLDDKQAEIFEQQGGTACVYPAPKFYMEGTSCGSHRIHIRPPYYKNCVIEANDEIKHAVELAGFDPTVVDDIQDDREQVYQNWLEYVNNNPDYEQDGLSGEPLARAKADEYADQALVDMGAKGSEHVEEQAAIVNEEVTDRHSNVEAQVTEIEPDAKPAEPSQFGGDPGDGPPPPDLDGGPDVGDIPEVGGDGPPDLDGMAGPDPNNLNSLNSDGSGGSGGEGLGGYEGSGFNGGGSPPGGYGGNGGLNGLDDENPFGSDIDDPDNLGGDPPGGYEGGDLGSTGGTPTGAYSGGTPPGGYSGGTPPEGYDGNGLDGYDSFQPDDEVGGGLASGGPGGLPGGGAPPTGGSSPNLSGGGPGVIGGGTPSGLRPGTSSSPRNLSPRSGGPSGLRPGSSTGPRVLSARPTTDATGTRPGSSGSGSGLRPGSSGTGSGLRPGSSAAGGPPGSGAGRGLGGTGTGAGTGAGGRGGGVHGAPGMLPGSGGSGKGDDSEHERQFWLVEDEDVWGGGPEFEEDDPYA